MSYSILINIDGIETTIADNEIIQATTSVTDKIKFNFDDMIASTTEFVLDDINGNYNPDNSNSIFYGNDWYNGRVSIYNNEVLIWNGLLKKLDYQGKDRTLKIKTKNYVQDIIDVECGLTIGTGASEFVTPAEIVLEILQNWVKIPSSNINQLGFNTAISYQNANNMFVELRLGQDNTLSSSEVILAMCRLTGAYLYTENNIVKFYQPTPYNGKLGEVIKASDIIEKTFKVTYDDKEVVNYANVFCRGEVNTTEVFLGVSEEYKFNITITTTSGNPVGNVTYFEPTGGNSLPSDAAEYLKVGYLINNGDVGSTSVPSYTTIKAFDVGANTITFSENATATGSDDFICYALEPIDISTHVKPSFDKYGLKSYKLIKNTPSSDVELINSHNILFKKFSYADNIINLKTLLNTSSKKYCSFQLDYNKNFIKLNDQLDLLFDTYIREPVRVIEKKVDSVKKRITLRCEFLNSPYEYYERDTDIPERFPIFSYFYDTDRIVTVWEDADDDASYYKVYFGETDTIYNAMSSAGMSPKTVINPMKNTNMQNYYTTLGMSFYKYFYKMTVFDSSENESDYSNIMQPLNIADLETYEKRYKIVPGNVIYTGVQAQTNIDYDIEEFTHSVFGDSVFGGDTVFGESWNYDYDGVWLPPEPVNFYNELNYDSDTYSYLGCYETAIIGNNKGIDTFIWKLNDFNQDTFVQYRIYDVNTSTFGSWSSLVNTTNRHFKFNLSGAKAVQFRIYFPDEYTIIYIEDIIQID